jgi:5,10-methylenetetrahydromethanopterin reductase
MSELPSVGVRLHSGLDPRRCVELARSAERNHLASVWFAENMFERGIMPAIAACATATEQVRLGIGVWNPFNRHPTLMAMEIGALDALSNGRAMLGIGSSRPAVVQQMGVDNRKPLSALRDTFHIVRALLHGDEVTYSGAVFAINKVKLGFQPLRPDVPLIMAARGDKTLKACGQIADGLIISNMSPASFTRRAVSIMRSSLEERTAKSTPSVTQYVACIIRPDSQEARRAIKPALAANIENYWKLGGDSTRQAMLTHTEIKEAEIQNAVDRLSAKESAQEVLDDRFVDAFTIAGNADECLEKIANYGRAGVSEVVLTFLAEQPVADMEYFGQALRSV